MRLIQVDDNQAFNEIYNRYKGPLYNYFSGLFDPQLAEDFLHDTFIKIVSKKETFRFDSSLKTWIWTIAKNNVRDHWRTRDHKVHFLFDELTDENGEEILISSIDAHDEAFFKKILRKQLIDCMNELPIEQRDIIHQHIQSELSNQEIAKLNNISLGAVKSILFRTKTKLTECFKRGGHL